LLLKTLWIDGRRCCGACLYFWASNAWHDSGGGMYSDFSVVTGGSAHEYGRMSLKDMVLRFMKGMKSKFDDHSLTVSRSFQVG
jgi:hypothetical protein